MTSALSGYPAAPALAEDAPGTLERAPAERCFAAGALDGALVIGALALVLGTELAVAPDAKTIFTYGWFVVFAPLYFALYHAYGTGATPGQLELRIAVRDAGTGARPSLGRSLGRAYLGFLLLLLGPAWVVDLLLLGTTGSSLRDRLTGTRVVRIALTGKAPELAQPTAPELRPLFEPGAGTHRYLARGWTLVRERARLLVGVVAALYSVVVALVLVLAFLLVADMSSLELVFVYLLLAPVLLASTIYWVQAGIAVAVEAVRVGHEDDSIWDTLVRASRRLNALSAALLLLLPIAFAAMYFPWLLFTLLLAGRVALVAPALALEDTRVLGAFHRSWQLTRGHTWRTLGLLLISALILFGALAVVIGITSAVLESTSSLASAAVAGILVLLLTGLPFVWLLAWIGASWSLLYSDLRRARPPGGVV
jgi:hypothetical protein